MSKPAPCVLPAEPRIQLDPDQRNPQLDRFKDLMHRMVIGQPRAIETTTNSFSRVLAGISDPERPILTQMLLGPTGVGKTETVRALAEALFGSRKAYTRINCQEYSAHYNLSKLLGSPPGYVGGEIKPLLCQENLDRHHKRAFEEGMGMFHEGLGKVSKLFPGEEGKHLSLVLFDEVEKAHPKLWNMLLGILEDGHLVLGNNEEVDFTRSIIILTTNVGSESMGLHIAQDGIGFRGGFEGDKLDHDIHEAAMREAKKVFPFEFINRFDELVVYDTLKESHLYQILDNLIATIHIRSIDCAEPFLLRVEPDAKTRLVEIGTDPQFGARPLRRAVETEVVTPLGNLICSGQIVRGDLITVAYRDGSFAFEKEPGAMTPEEIAQFDAMREERDKSRDLEGNDDGGEANRIQETVDTVVAGSKSLMETGTIPRN